MNESLIPRTMTVPTIRLIASTRRLPIVDGEVKSLPDIVADLRYANKGSRVTITDIDRLRTFIRADDSGDLGIDQYAAATALAFTDDGADITEWYEYQIRVINSKKREGEPLEPQPVSIYLLPNGKWASFEEWQATQSVAAPEAPEPVVDDPVIDDAKEQESASPFKRRGRPSKAETEADPVIDE